MIELSKYQQTALDSLSIEDDDERREAISKLFLAMEVDMGYLDERRSDAESLMRKLADRDVEIRVKMRAIKVLLEDLKPTNAEEAEKMENILKLFNTL